MGCGCKKKTSQNKGSTKTQINKERLEEVRQRIIKLSKEGKKNTKG